ncbi:hypothetical protein P12x_001193 [Tundrisphaera lichenicola]|uniref:hypothetical protein n=1 Tax=Tundrisphaera lichenicola TaxID=2029860 RepID=UPI003EC07DB1
MSKVANTFVEQRARVLAMVQFTTRADLQVDAISEDSGFDLLVRITSEGKVRQSVKAFGVVLKGTNRPLRGAEDADRLLQSGSSKKSDVVLTSYSFPVLMLLFSMQNDNGYFAWRAEPIVTPSREPRLQVHESYSFSTFDRAALGIIVDQVDEWYKTLFTLLDGN